MFVQKLNPPFPCTEVESKHEDGPRRRYLVCVAAWSRVNITALLFIWSLCRASHRLNDAAHIQACVPQLFVPFVSLREKVSIKCDTLQSPTPPTHSLTSTQSRYIQHLGGLSHKSPSPVSHMSPRFLSIVRVRPTSSPGNRLPSASASHEN